MRDETPDSNWEAAPLDWFKDDIPPPTKPEHRASYALWLRAERYREAGRPRTLIRFATRQRTYNPYQWEVPFSTQDYRLEQYGDEWVVTFLPLAQEIYRGRGPVTISSV